MNSYDENNQTKQKSDESDVIRSTRLKYRSLGYTIVLSNKNAGDIVGEGVTSDIGSVPVFIGDDISGSSYRKVLDAHLAKSDQELLARSQLVSANVYLGAKEIADALSAGAQVVVTGRVADPALTVGPLMAHFKKSWEDWDFLASATMAGHLLECGAQVTGGYFADPGYKNVPNLSNVGFPIVEFDAQGNL